MKTTTLTRAWCIGGTALTLAACGGSGTPAPQAAGEARATTITLRKDDAGKPGKETKTFSQADPVWHVEIALDRIVTNSAFRLELTGKQTSQYKDKKLGTIEGRLAAANNLTFKVPIEGKMPIGVFGGDVYLGERKLTDFTFMVEPANGESAFVAGDARLLKDSGKGVAGEVVKAFRPTDRHVFFEVDVKGASATPATIKWVHTAAGPDGRPVAVADASRDIVIDNSIIEGDIEMPRDWPVAKYRSELSINGKPFKTIEWEVQGAAPAPANTGATGKAFAALKLITAKNGLVQVTAPGDWVNEDKSTQDEAKLELLAPDQTGYLAVTAFELGAKQAPASFFVEQLDKTLKERYADDKSFQHQPAEAQADGSALKLFALDVKLGDGKLHRMIGMATAQQSGSIYISKRLIVEKDALAANKDMMNKVLAFVQARGASDAQGAGPLQIGELRTFAHKSGAFSIKAPAAWKLMDNSKPGNLSVSFVEPQGRAMIGIDMFVVNRAADEAMLRDAVSAFVRETYRDADGLRIDAARIDNGVASVLFTFNGTVGGRSVPMVGAAYLTQASGRAAILRSAAPSADAQRLLDGFNEIGFSFKPDYSVKF